MRLHTLVEKGLVHGTAMTHRPYAFRRILMYWYHPVLFSQLPCGPGVVEGKVRIRIVN
jgi:hypothetical protein